MTCQGSLVCTATTLNLHLANIWMVSGCGREQKLEMRRGKEAMAKSMRRLASLYRGNGAPGGSRGGTEERNML